LGGREGTTRQALGKERVVSIYDVQYVHSPRGALKTEGEWGRAETSRAAKVEGREEEEEEEGRRGREGDYCRVR
jgi:hypothetical protein